MSLILSNAPLDLRQKFESCLRQEAAKGIAKNFILVIPTNRNVRALKHEIIKNSGEAQSTLNIYTLELLMRRIYLELKQRRFEIEPDMQSILVEEAAIKLLKENQLGFFRARPDGKLPKGTFDKVFKIIREFKEDGLYAADLEKDLTAIDEKELDKTTDIYKIYKQYNEFLGERFIDKGDIYKSVTEKFLYPFSIDLFKKSFPDINGIYFRGFSEFSLPEIKFITALSEIKELSLFFEFDYNDSNLPLFGIMKQNVDSFFGLNFMETVSDAENQNQLKEHIQKNLFRRNKEKPVKDCSENITLFSAKERLEEVEKTIKIIKSIILQNPDQDLSKICVVTYSTNKYTELFREYFEKYGLPANITDRFVLSASPLVAALVSFLQIPVNNYRKKELFRALLSPYLVFKKTDGKKIDANTLYETANNLKISFGKESWTEKIERKLHFLEKRRNEDDDKNIKKEIFKLKEAKSDFEFIVSLLSPFENKLSSRDFEIEITRLIAILEVPSQIIQIKNDTGARFLMEKDLRALSSFLAILKNMNNLYELKTEAENLYSLKEYMDDLKTAISNTRYNVKQKNGYGILVTAAEEIRGLSFDYIFLAGMVDGEFPAVFKPEIFKPEIRRKSEEKHYLESRYLFYQIMTSFEKALFISYPKYDNDSELLPSSFLDSLKEIIICSENINEYIENKIYSTGELQAYLGQCVKQGSIESKVFEKYKEEINIISLKSEIEKSRTSGHSMPEFEGIIQGHISEAAEAGLKEYRNKEFSISELEEYGKCPMRYLFSRALRIEVTEEIDDDITAIEFGSVIHDTLFDFFTNWKKENSGKSFYGQTKEEIDNCRNRIISIAAKKVDELNITNPFFKIDFLKVIGDGKTKNGILKNFIDFELQKKNELFGGLQFEPSHFEVSFGKNPGAKDSVDTNLSTNESVRLGDVAMRGKVDRIDICKNKSEIIFVIFDYKTGKYIPGLKQITEGTSLQLPIYIACIIQLLEKNNEVDALPAGGIYYLLGDQISLNTGFGDKAFYEGQRSTKKLMDKELFDKTIEDSKNFVKEYVNNISEGKFGYPKAERDLDEMCKFCNFITICRIKCINIIENNI